MLVSLWVPFFHLQDARHVNLAACGAPFSTSRAASKASTLTPLFAFVFSIMSLPKTGPSGRLRAGAGSYIAQHYDGRNGHRTGEARRRLGGHGRHAVPGSPGTGAARLRADAAHGPGGLRNLRHAVAGARQRDP